MNLPGHLHDITQLRAAVAVWREGGVTSAAACVGLSQPAVSRLVAALEERIGFALFLRHRKRLAVTEPGAAFLIEAEAALGGLARLSELAGTLRLGQSGLLRVAAVSALAHGLAPRALAALRRTFPDLAIEMEECDRRQQVEGLQSRHFDVGLLALPSAAPGLRVDMIIEGDAVVLLPSDHRLATHDVLDPQTLAGERFVRLREMRLLQSLVDSAFDQVGLSRPISVTVDSTPLMIASVAGRLGLAITHRIATLALPHGVVARNFAPRLTFGYAAVTRGDEPVSGVVKTFIGLAREVAVQELGGFN
jgi:DNA-binding transcriptional LysR family regulator